MVNGESGNQRRRNPAGPIASRIEQLNEIQFAYLLLSPVILLLLAIAVWPLIGTFQMSLQADALRGASNVGEFVGFQNYIELITGQRDAVMARPFLDLSNPLQSALVVTIIFAVVSVTLETLIGFAQALILDQEFWGRRWVRVAIIIPWSVPIVIQGMIFFLMFSPAVGFAVEPMQQLGIFSSTPLNNSVDSLIIVILADVWKTSAFMALLILAGLQSIDRSLYDVAKVSGASRWQSFRMITLPLVMPAIIVAMLFRTIDAMRIYGLIESITTCSTVPSLSCMVVSTFGARRYGTSAAIAFITATIIGVAVLVYIAKFSDNRGGGF